MQHKYIIVPLNSSLYAYACICVMKQKSLDSNFKEIYTQYECAFYAYGLVRSMPLF